MPLPYLGSFPADTGERHTACRVSQPRAPSPRDVTGCVCLTKPTSGCLNYCTHGVESVQPCMWIQNTSEWNRGIQEYRSPTRGTRLLGARGAGMVTCMPFNLLFDDVISRAAV